MAGIESIKTCSKCGETKPLEQFYKQKWCAMGVRPECRTCCYAISKARLADPERAAANKTYKKQYRRKNRDAILARDRAYYEANKERMLAYGAEYNRKNRDAYNERLRRWRKKNSEQVNVWTRNRRAKLKSLGGTHSLQDIMDLLDKQRGKCIYCRVDITKKRQVDHIVPVKLGGSNDKSNLQLLCKPCNLLKNAKDPLEFAQSLGKLL